MPAEPAYVILGASLAGAKAAETLRAEGFEGPVILVGDDAHRPYERPPLSKGFLLGKEDAAKAYVHDEDWYQANDVDLRLGIRATAIDVAAKTVALSDGDPLPYGKLLITTGASPRRLNVPGADQDGVLYLRTMADSERLRTVLRGGGQVVIAGGGWIGLETAAAARR
jgi:3-phenylpropionate/trans-cinnamate dioxygenase ferredoxin reductase subunit